MFEGKFNSENSPALKLGSEWKDIITNPSTVDLYFQVIFIVTGYKILILINIIIISSDLLDG